MSALAELLGVTPQAISKTTKALADAGYVEVRAGADARVREVALSPRGRAGVEAARTARADLQAELVAQHGAARVDAARALLVEVLSSLGVLGQVVDRTLGAPED